MACRIPIFAIGLAVLGALKCFSQTDTTTRIWANQGGIIQSAKGDV